MDTAHGVAIEYERLTHLGRAYRRQRWFFVSMAAAIAVSVFIGFAPSYYLRGPSAARSLSLLVHVHGALFTAWILIFVVQASLVAARQVSAHRRLGFAAALLVVPMLVSGISVAVAAARIEPLNAADTVVGMPRLVFLVIPFTSVLLFSLLAGLGLWYRRVADVHKRFLLLATIALLPPALGRIPALAARGPAAFFGVTILFIVALVGHDYWTRGRTHPVSLWAGLVLVVSFPGRVALGYTDAWQAFAQWLTVP